MRHVVTQKWSTLRLSSWVALAAGACLLPSLTARADEAEAPTASGIEVAAESEPAEPAGEFFVVGQPAAPAANATPATHQQVREIRPGGDDHSLKLTSFCVTPAGQILAIVSNVGADSHAPEAGGLISGVVSLFGGGSQPKKSEPRTEVRVLDAEGKLLESWPLDFAAHAINVCPTGEIVVGGDGVLARYDAHGKQLARGEAPHVAATRGEAGALERQAREIVESQAESLKEALADFERQKTELQAKPADELNDEERQVLQTIDQTIAAYRQIIDQQQNVKADDGQVQQMVQYLSTQQKKVNAIAASGSNVYVTCVANKGFGYDVWRTDLEFGSPEKIVSGLGGCCGQMDVQCCGEELIVAENARHRVVKFDISGKELKSWGKRSRDGDGETFGGCCNPMNTRLVGDKLYVAESDGQIKLFSPEGEFQGVLGKANVQAGCKSSIVDASADGDRLYYFDVNNSAICVLERSPK